MTFPPNFQTFITWIGLIYHDLPLFIDFLNTQSWGMLNSYITKSVTLYFHRLVVVGEI